VRDLAGGHGGQPCEEVAEVGVGIDLAPPAAFDDPLEDRSVLAGPGLAEEELVLLAQEVGRGG
jgi:hypothetical protein